MRQALPDGSQALLRAVPRSLRGARLSLYFSSSSDVWLGPFEYTLQQHLRKTSEWYYT